MHETLASRPSSPWEGSGRSLKQLSCTLLNRSTPLSAILRCAREHPHDIKWKHPESILGGAGPAAPRKNPRSQSYYIIAAAAIQYILYTLATLQQAGENTKRGKNEQYNIILCNMYTIYRD